VVARSGLGHIVVTAASYEQVGRDNILFNQYRQEVGLAPDALPIIYIIGAYCAETEEKAQKGYEYLAALGTVGAYHYGFSGPNLTDFSKIKGYESYAKGLPGASQSAPDPEAARRAAFVGTPDQLIEKVQRIRTESGAREIVIAFDVVGSMPYEDAERSMSLFAREVLPAVHEIQVGPPAVLAGGSTRPE
jgi:alkanesulfonate monooxygenase SsuD/methylene tetrahydromethanopterin reductase-like flavin-dependent oxidoreductase (luciferase family)